MNHPQWTRTMLPAAAVALLGLLAAPLLGQGAAPTPAAPGGGFHHDHGMMMRGAMKALNLTDEQKASAKQLFQEMKAKSAPLSEAQRALHQQFAAALKADSPDAAAVGQLAIQMHQNRLKMKPLHDELQQKLQALLTPEQQTKFQALQQSRQFHHPFSPPAPDTQ
ncbi:MAG TPA: Spy/CpxP family protein refolding chaperone [Thermoanaerobaculia bacterium]|nr:Spy/CpxP family protein refolding chaperone [Thermoanaerobaculia bacterium]